MSKLCAVPDILPAHQRLIVGEGEADVALRYEIESLLYQLLRGDIQRSSGLVRHGDLRVLAEGTAEVAPVAAGGEDELAGAESAQRLFFHRIQIQSGELAVVCADYCSALVDPRAAQTGLPLLQRAVMKADGTDRRHVCLTTSKR